MPPGRGAKSGAPAAAWLVRHGAGNAGAGPEDRWEDRPAFRVLVRVCNNHRPGKQGDLSRTARGVWVGRPGGTASASPSPSAPRPVRDEGAPMPAATNAKPGRRRAPDVVDKA